MARYLPDTWPLPALDPTTRPFFTSGTLVVQQCAACGTVQHPPEEVCHRCRGMAFHYPETRGTGTIASYVVQHHPPAPALKDAVPYNVVLVALDDHPHVRVLGNVINRRPDQLAIGQRVRAVFEPIADPDLGETLYLPQWEVVDD